jgi:hypothetical protein
MKTKESVTNIGIVKYLGVVLYPTYEELYRLMGATTKKQDESHKDLTPKGGIENLVKRVAGLKKMGNREKFFIAAAWNRYHNSKNTACAFVEGAKFADKFADWHIVYDEYPQNGQLVLALDKSKHLHVARFFKYKDSQAWVDQTDNDHEYCSIEYWMPLPKYPCAVVQDGKEG